MLNEEEIKSFSMFMKVAELIANHPELKVDAQAILRHGIKSYPDESGSLWSHLACYYIN